MTVSYLANYPDNMNTIQSYSYKKDVRGGGVSAMLGGCAIGCLAIPVKLLTPKAIDKIEFSILEQAEIFNASMQALRNRKLGEKNVKIAILNNHNPQNDSFFDKLSSFFVPYERIRRSNNIIFLTKDLKGIDHSIGEKQIVAEKNTILISKKNEPGQLLNALGHADNFNNGNVLKVLQKTKPVAMCLPLLVLLYGAFSKNSRPKDGSNELTGAQKTNNFIRNNAGKLSFLAMLPILIEEAAATIKGHLYTQKSISKDVANKALLTNGLGFAAYVAVAIIAGIASRTAVKIKDNKIAKKERAIQYQRRLYFQ